MRRARPRRPCTTRQHRSPRAPSLPFAPLADPNLDSPLNGHAASIWHNVAEYKKALLKHKTTHGTERRAS